MPTVVSAILEYPENGELFGSYKDGSRPYCGSCRLKMTMSDGSTSYFEYFDYEVSIQPSEVIGLTYKQVSALHYKKDLEFIRG